MDTGVDGGWRCSTEFILFCGDKRQVYQKRRVARLLVVSQAVRMSQGYHLGLASSFIFEHLILIFKFLS